MSKVPIYNEAFQKTVWTCSRFRQFVAGLTMFDGTEPLADISASHRWHRRSRGLRSTADLLIIFYALDTNMRLAVFVDHKYAGAAWSHNRPQGSELRGLRCNTCQTMLIAPRRLIEKHVRESAVYDIRLAYEQFSDFVPLFSEEIDDMDYRPRPLNFPDGGLI